jgi:hypothetical protein
MSFDPIVYGSYVVGTGFTDGSTSNNFGMQVFIKINANLGANPLDVTISYVDQFGNSPETCVVSTSVPAYATAGAHIQIVLNGGDSGIRDVTNCTVVGGTVGDSFNLESWNEGGGHTFGLSRMDAGYSWEDTEPVKEIMHHENSWIIDEVMDVALVNTVKAGTTTNQTFISETEIYQPSYESEFNRFGFLETSTIDVQDSGLKRLISSLYPSLVLTTIDANEPSTRYKWLWNGSAYEDSGFYQIDFDFALVRRSYFTFEVLDKDGTIRFTRASNTGGWTTPSTIQSYCGQETSYPASNSKEGNISTEWRHLTDHVHWIIYDLGTTTHVGGVKFYWQGLSTNYTIDIYGSDNLTDWTLEYEDWDISGAAPMWKELEFIPIFKRYIKLMIYTTIPSHYLYDFMDVKFYLLEHQSLVFKSLAFEMRLRLSTNGTTDGTEYLDIRNVKIYRYKHEGTVTSSYPVSVPNISTYDELLKRVTLPTC